MKHALEAMGPFDGLEGQLYGYLFENSLTGLKRGLFWNLFIKCRPIEYLGEWFEPAILVDWLDARSLGRAVVTSADNPRFEASFYMGWHDPVSSWKLEIEHDGFGLPRRVRYDMVVDFAGYENDPCPGLRISGMSPVDVRNIGVMPEDFDPQPSNHQEAREMIAPFYPHIREWVDVQAKDDESRFSAVSEKLLFAPRR